MKQLFTYGISKENAWYSFSCYDYAEAFNGNLFSDVWVKIHYLAKKVFKLFFIAENKVLKVEILFLAFIFFFMNSFPFDFKISSVQE